MGSAEGLRNQVKLKFRVLASLLFLCCCKAELQIVETPSPIQALLGRDVTIPCVLTGDNYQNLDLSIVGIRWKKILSNGREIDVYKFLNLRHHEIRNGSYIDERELRRGNASLTLHHVRRSDEGEYSCTVFVTPNKGSATIIVQLLAQPDVTLPTTELTAVRGSERSITCDVSKYYPEAVKIRWVKFSKTFRNTSSLDEATYFTVPKENSDGTFSMTSLLTVKPSSLKEKGDIYFCNVEHASYSHGTNVTFTLKVEEPPLISWHIALIILSAVMVMIMAAFLVLYCKPAPPKISDITGLEDLVHGKSTTLSCMVSGFKPRNIKIQFCVKRDGDDIMEIGSWVYPTPKHEDTVDFSRKSEQVQIPMMPQRQSSLVDPKPLKSVKSYFSYSCFCFADILTDLEKHKGAKLIIKVTHRALKSPLIIEKTLEIQGDFLRLSTIRAPQSLKHGERVTLTCEIFTCSKQPLHITWLKKDMKKKKPTVTVYKKGKETSDKYEYEENEQTRNHVLCTTSIITFTLRCIEDHEAKYICNVSYPAISQTLKSYLETFVTAVPVLGEIQSSQLVPCVGRQMKLSCRIHSFNPKHLIVQWCREDMMLPSLDYEVVPGEDGLFSTTSILTYIPMIEDKGKVFKCIVDHQSFTEPKVLSWKMENLSVDSKNQ